MDQCRLINSAIRDLLISARSQTRAGLRLGLASGSGHHHILPAPRSRPRHPAGQTANCSPLSASTSTRSVGAPPAPTRYTPQPLTPPESHAAAARRSSMPLLDKARSRTADRGRTLTVARLAIAKGFLGEYAKLDQDVQSAVDAAITTFARHPHAGQHLEKPR